MSKLTFRADDELVERVERLEASKSQIMREALRSYLEGVDSPEETTLPDSRSPSGSIDAVVDDRVDAAIEERLQREREVNVNVTVESPERNTVETSAEDERVKVNSVPDDTPSELPTADGRCDQCGEPVDANHVYCPNCGEKRSRRVFCECGDELRTDWSFCPGCGRRTPTADVLESS